MTKARVAGAAFALALALNTSPSALAQGCAMCKRNLESNGGAGLLEGFYWSILLLVGTPIVLVSTVIFLIVRAGRRAQASAPVPDDREGPASSGGLVAATGLEPVT